jgi:hypothetical protein
MPSLNFSLKEILPLKEGTLKKCFLEMSRVSLREGRDRQERKKSPKIGGSGAIAHAEAPCCSSFDIQNPSAIGDLFELCCDVVMSYLVLLNRRFEASVAYKKHVVRNISLAMSGYSLHLSLSSATSLLNPPTFFSIPKLGLAYKPVQTC